MQLHLPSLLIVLLPLLWGIGKDLMLTQSCNFNISFLEWMLFLFLRDYFCLRDLIKLALSQFLLLSLDQRWSIWNKNFNGISTGLCSHLSIPIRATSNVYVCVCVLSFNQSIFLNSNINLTQNSIKIRNIEIVLLFI